MKRHHLHISGHALFAIVWFIMLVCFVRETIHSNRLQKISLPRYQARIPDSYNVQIGSIKFQEVINGIAESHNKSVDVLETSIRDSASLAFRLNLISAICCVIGLFAQVTHFLHGHYGDCKHTDDSKDNPQAQIAVEPSKIVSQPAKSERKGDEIKN